MRRDIVVACADVGSAARGRFGWWSQKDASSGSRPSELADHIAALLNDGRRVALGFECPLFVPLADDQLALTSARPGEGSRAWSAGAGCGALATGLVQVAWVLRAVRSQLKQPPSAHLSWQDFDASTDGPSLLLWEAFVTGNAKRSSHVEDAAAGVQAFIHSLENPVQANAVLCDGQVLSLVGAALLRTGWRSDLGVLNDPCLVIRAA
jgi:hypothetical protein